LEPLPRERTVVFHAAGGNHEDDVARAGHLIALLDLRLPDHVALEASEMPDRTGASSHGQKHDACDDYTYGSSVEHGNCGADGAARPQPLDAAQATDATRWAGGRGDTARSDRFSWGRSSSVPRARVRTDI